jgi:L-lactate dehydrogenase (cytochrome)
VNRVVGATCCLVRKSIDIIRNELSTTMGLCGVNTMAEIDDHVLAV